MPPKKQRHQIVSKKHIARQEREQRQVKAVVLVTGAVLLIVVGILGYVLINTLIVQPNTVVASVGETKIRVKDFQPEVKYSRLNLINQASQYLTYAQMFGEMGTTFLQTAQQMVMQLSIPEQMGEQTINRMVDDVLIAEEAAKRDITVSAQEVAKELQTAFQFFPEGTNTPSPSPTSYATPTLSKAQIDLIKPTEVATAEPTPVETENEAQLTPTEAVEGEAPAASTPETGDLPESAVTPTVDPNATPTVQPSLTPTPTVYTTKLYGKDISEYYTNLKTLNIDRKDVESVFKAQLLRQKLLDDVTKDLKPEAEQVWARHILVATEDEANQVLDELAAGKDWKELAATYSTDPGSKDNGGDLGWFSRGRMVKPFEDAAFALKNVGDISEPIQSEHGWHIIQLIGHQVNPISSAELLQEKETLFNNWLKEIRDSRSDITIFDVWKENTPTVPAVPSDMLSAMYGQ